MSSIVRMLACARHQGAKLPTPTQSTCLYYYHDNEASKCVWAMLIYPAASHEATKLLPPMPHVRSRDRPGGLG